MMESMPYPPRSRKSARRLLGFVLALTILLAKSSLASRCIGYGSVTLEGILVRQTYAGPPDFESVTQGDAPVIIWVLQLNESMCVESGSRTRREFGVRELQLELTADQRMRAPELLGKRLLVGGELVRGAARHEMRSVLVVRSMDIAPTLRDR
jgi:hypothetical protein